MAAARGGPGVELCAADVSAADRLFLNLDRCPVAASGGGPAVEVLGVHVTPDRDAWVQVSIAGDPLQAVILHVLATTPINETLAALAAWAEMAPDERPRSIDLTPTDGVAGLCLQGRCFERGQASSD